MMKNFLNLTMLLLLSIPVNTTNKEFNKSLASINLDYVDDDEKKSWGLMQRRSIPNDYGMLFVFPSPSKIDLWSFNCYTDLAVAFLDDRGIILEIKYLKAFPEMMDPLRPVYSLSDMHQYKHNDPILQFYASHSVTSSHPCTYALETSPSFFQINCIGIGDQLILENTKSGYFFRFSL